MKYWVQISVYEIQPDPKLKYHGKAMMINQDNIILDTLDGANRLKNVLMKVSSLWLLFTQRI